MDSSNGANAENAIRLYPASVAVAIRVFFYYLNHATFRRVPSRKKMRSG